jgi:pilus assembly protein CpaB
MRWAVTILIILGLLAAISAAILVGTLRSDSSAAGNGSSAEVKVLLAKMSLPAMSVVTSTYVTEGTALRKELPQSYLTSPVQAIGKILAVPVVEGQVMTASCFVTEGSEAQLAAAIPPGMRAVSVTLSSLAVSGGLLYPGCMVDVLVSFGLKTGGRDNRGEALSTTLLHGIQVLAIENNSVVSKQDDDKKKGALGQSRTGSGNVSVALMVDPRQAEALQLATDYGKISLSMRNPLDRYPVDIDATVLSEGRLAKLGSVLTPSVLATVLADNSPKGSETDNLRISTMRGSETPAGEEKGLRALFGTDKDLERSPRWGVTVIRGRDVLEQEMDVPGEAGSR